VLRKLLTCGLTLLFLLSSSTVNYADTAASVSSQDSETSQSSCTPVDVIFVMDQSSSMGGVECGTGTKIPNPNDPTGQREFAAEAMVDLLADLSLDVCPGSVNRIAVISFGTAARVDLPLTDIDPTTFESSQALRESIKDSIIADNLCQTNPIPAFREAINIFKKSEDSISGKRKRVIVFITDGTPCLTELGCGVSMDVIGYVKNLRNIVEEELPFDSILLKQEQCLQNLEDKYQNSEPTAEELNKCLSDYHVDDQTFLDSTYIYTILLNQGLPYPDNFRAEIEAMSEDHGGRLVTLSSNRQDIPATFKDILADLADVDIPSVDCGSFVVNPYQKRAILVFYKYDPDIKVTLSYEDIDGTEHSIMANEQNLENSFNVAEYQQYGANERYVFNNPYPGKWRLESENCSGLDAYYQEVQINTEGYDLGFANIPQYDIEPYYDEDNPYYIEYQMQDTTGIIIPQADDARFNVDMDVTVTDPMGNTKDYPMKYIENEDIFKSESPIEVRYLGTYKVNIKGTTIYHEGTLSIGNELPFEQIFNSNRTLFEHNGLSFVTTPVTPFIIESVTPNDGEKVGDVHATILDGWPLKSSPLHVEVKLTDRSGNPLDPGLIFENSQTPLKVSLISSPEVEPILMVQDPVHPEVYSADIETNQSGEMQLKVELIEKPQGDYRADRSVLDITFERYDTFFHRETSYYLLLGLFVLLLVVGLIIRSQLRNNRVMGELVFIDEGNEESYPLYSKWNWKVVSKHWLKAHPYLNLKYIRVTNSGRPKSKKKKDQDEIEEWNTNYFDESINSGITVTYQVDKPGSRKNVLALEPKIPVTYSQDTTATMVYKPD